MNLRYFEMFRLVSALGSVSQAAARTGMSQPGLSRIIREIEKTYGLSLFDRTGRGVRLSAEGIQFDQQVQRILAEYNALRDLTSELRGEQVGGVRLSIPLRTGRFLLAPLIQRFSAAYPSASIHVFENLNPTTQESLLTQENDIGIFYAPPVPSGLLEEIIGEECLYVVGRPDILANQRDGVPMAAVADMPVLIQSSPAHYRTFIERAFRDHGHIITVARELETFDAHISFAAAGEGVTVLPLSTVFEEVERGELVAYPIVEPEIRRSVMIAGSSQAASPLVRGAIELLKDLVDETRARSNWRAV